MITNFESFTDKLTVEENQITRTLMMILSKATKQKPIKSGEIIDSVNGLKNFIGIRKDIDGIMVRKMINFIRREGLLPVIGCGNGYYVSYDPDDIKKAIKSLQERVEAIQIASFGLEKYIKHG